MIKTVTQKIMSLAICMLVLGLFFTLGKPYMFNLAFGQQAKSMYVLLEDVPVLTLVNAEGYRQVGYNFGNKDFVVSTGNYTNSDPTSDGSYVVWMAQIDGYWQIFLNNVVTEKTIQLTYVGNNVNPSVSNGKVVWESQIDGVWQIMLFDGIKISQITKGLYPSKDARIENDYVAYLSMEKEGGDWKAFVYKITTGRALQLTLDGNSTDINMSDNMVFWSTQANDKFSNFSYDIATDTLSNAKKELDVVSSFDTNAYEEFENTIVPGNDLSKGSFEDPILVNDVQIETELTPQEGVLGTSESFETTESSSE